MILRRLKAHVEKENWFAVFIDFCIVVVGVGVALAGQQWLNEQQQRAEMRTAEAALQLDLFTNYVTALERVSLSQCRKNTYAAIAEQLLETNETWTPLPLIDNPLSGGNVLPRMLHAPLRPWGSSTWESGLARGTFDQMDEARRGKLDDLFQQAELAQVLQSEIFTLLSRMKLLAVSTAITPEERSRYYDRLGELDDKGALLESLSRNIIRQMADVGLDLPDEIVSEALKNLPAANASRETSFGSCFVPMEYSLLKRSEASP